MFLHHIKRIAQGYSLSDAIAQRSMTESGTTRLRNKNFSMGGRSTAWHMFEQHRPDPLDSTHLFGVDGATRLP